ncbi:MAG TPA: MAPEG family protein [Sphingomonas sp.]|uniref:MAPEG family protein n=1 Tax=Sphingomonas sp. TaxID=28214 RepID=UPI002BED7CEA|nr:MAPEG family protein [Sphingomonas sp.]HMI17967.1 MAPEG family protein [Sphingomonas sp.]
MAIELYLLGATLILALVQILLTAHVRTRQYGIKWNAGARDAKMPPLETLPARLQRAQENLFETLPLFVGALLGAAYAGRLGLLTNLGAHLYFFGRLIYLPLYAAGIPYVRSLVWTVATGGLVLVIAGLMLG